MKRLLTVIGIVAILSILWSFFIKDADNKETVYSPTTVEEVGQAVDDADVEKDKSGVFVLV